MVFDLTVERSTLTLRRTHSRVSWVPDTVSIRRHEEPLRHVLEENAWPAGTGEVAVLLEELGVAQDATVAVAMTALKKANQGRRKLVVAAAQRFRRSSQ